MSSEKYLKSNSLTLLDNSVSDDTELIPNIEQTPHKDCSILFSEKGSIGDPSSILSNLEVTI